MNHVDRVRAFLKQREKMQGMDPELIYGLNGREFELRTADLDALCRDAERLAEIEVI